MTTDLVIDITAHIENNKKYKNQLVFLSDISRVADGVDKSQEHHIKTDWKDKYGVSEKEFLKLSRFLTYIASEEYEKHEDKIKNFLK